MTIQELIEALSEYPKDMEVALFLDFGKWRNITKVSEAMKYRVKPNGDGTFDDQESIKFVGIQ